MQREYTDIELLELVKKNSEQGIELLFRRYYAYLCKVVYKVLPDKGIAEDIVQEVFYELWRKREKISFSSSISAYLRKAAINKTLNYIRDKKMHTEDDSRLNYIGTKEPGAQRDLETGELKVFIDEVIDGLPERCRMVFVLSRFEEMSYKEIANEMGISVKTVENQISKALKILRDKLGPYLGCLLLIICTGAFPRISELSAILQLLF